MSNLVKMFQKRIRFKSFREFLKLLISILECADKMQDTVPLLLVFRGKFLHLVVESTVKTPRRKDQGNEQ